MENKGIEPQYQTHNRRDIGAFNESHHAFYNSIIDLTTTTPGNNYLDKVEDAIKMYISHFLKPKYEGLDVLGEISFNKTKTSDSYGDTTIDGSKITLHIANLLSPDILTTEQRNLEFFHFFMTAEHEVRHYYQVKLRQELEKGDLADKDKIEKYKNVFGDKAEEIAYSTEEIITDKHISALKHFLDSNTAHLSNSEYNDLKKQLENLENFHQYYIYLPSLHEFDARQASLKAITNISEMLIKHHEFVKFINFANSNISTDSWSSMVEGLKQLTDKAYILDDATAALKEVAKTQKDTLATYNQKYKEYKDMLDKTIGNLQPEQIFKFIQDNASDKNRVQIESDLLMNFKQFKDFFNNEEKVQKLEQLCRQHGLDWVLDDDETTQDNNQTQSIKKPEKETEKLEDEYEFEL